MSVVGQLDPSHKYFSLRSILSGLMFSLSGSIVTCSKSWNFTAVKLVILIISLHYSARIKLNYEFQGTQRRLHGIFHVPGSKELQKGESGAGDGFSSGF